jgi:2-oxo-4-hydroxy-4-carboxy-5-ureidoimidazoline decarboxylase
MRLATRERQLELIRAHPELAARATMTPDSVAEQRGAGLDQLTANEHAALLKLNRQYRERFGFPFILAVKGKDKNDIRAALEARVRNDPETEFQTALSEIEKIAGFRLEALVTD